LYSHPQPKAISISCCKLDTCELLLILDSSVALKLPLNLPTPVLEVLTPPVVGRLRNIQGLQDRYGRQGSTLLLCQEAESIFNQWHRKSAAPLRLLGFGASGHLRKELVSSYYFPTPKKQNRKRSTLPLIQFDRSMAMMPCEEGNR